MMGFAACQMKTITMYIFLGCCGASFPFCDAKLALHSGGGSAPSLTLSAPRPVTVKLKGPLALQIGSGLEGSESRDRFVLSQEAVKTLREEAPPGPYYVVAVHGVKRNGKSTLATLLLRQLAKSLGLKPEIAGDYQGTFRTSAAATSYTRGHHICYFTNTIPGPHKGTYIVIDSEGTESEDTGSGYDMKLFYFAYGMSSAVLVRNSSGITIERHTISTLQASLRAVEKAAARVHPTMMLSMSDATHGRAESLRGEVHGMLSEPVRKSIQSNHIYFFPDPRITKKRDILNLNLVPAGTTCEETIAAAGQDVLKTFFKAETDAQLRNEEELANYQQVLKSLADEIKRVIKPVQTGQKVLTSIAELAEYMQLVTDHCNAFGFPNVPQFEDVLIQSSIERSTQDVKAALNERLQTLPTSTSSAGASTPGGFLQAPQNGQQGTLLYDRLNVDWIRHPDDLFEKFKSKVFSGDAADVLPKVKKAWDEKCLPELAKMILEHRENKQRISFSDHGMEFLKQHLESSLQSEFGGDAADSSSLQPVTPAVFKCKVQDTVWPKVKAVWKKEIYVPTLEQNYYPGHNIWAAKFAENERQEWERLSTMQEIRDLIAKFEESNSRNLDKKRKEEGKTFVINQLRTRVATIASSRGSVVGLGTKHDEIRASLKEQWQSSRFAPLASGEGSSAVQDAEKEWAELFETECEEVLEQNRNENEEKDQNGKSFVQQELIEQLSRIALPIKNNQDYEKAIQNAWTQVRDKWIGQGFAPSDAAERDAKWTELKQLGECVEAIEEKEAENVWSETSSESESSESVLSEPTPEVDLDGPPCGGRFRLYSASPHSSGYPVYCPSAGFCVQYDHCIAGGAYDVWNFLQRSQKDTDGRRTWCIKSDSTHGEGTYSMYVSGEECVQWYVKQCYCKGKYTVSNYSNGSDIWVLKKVGTLSDGRKAYILINKPNPQNPTTNGWQIFYPSEHREGGWYIKACRYYAEYETNQLYWFSLQPV